MARPGLEALSKVLWSLARHPLLAAAWAISTGRRGLLSAGSRIQRRIEARLRDVLFVVVFAMVGLVLAAAGAVFLLMAAWGALAAYLGPNGASLAMGVALLGGSILPLAMAVWRATPRHRVRD